MVPGCRCCYPIYYPCEICLHLFFAHQNASQPFQFCSYFDPHPTFQESCFLDTAWSCPFLRLLEPLRLISRSPRAPPPLFIPFLCSSLTSASEAPLGWSHSFRVLQGSPGDMRLFQARMPKA